MLSRPAAVESGEEDQLAQPRADARHVIGRLRCQAREREDDFADVICVHRRTDRRGCARRCGTVLLKPADSLASSEQYPPTRAPDRVREGAVAPVPVADGPGLGVCQRCFARRGRSGAIRRRAEVVVACSGARDLQAPPAARPQAPPAARPQAPPAARPGAFEDRDCKWTGSEAGAR